MFTWALHLEFWSLSFLTQSPMIFILLAIHSRSYVPAIVFNSHCSIQNTITCILFTYHIPPTLFIELFYYNSLISLEQSGHCFYLLSMNTFLSLDSYSSLNSGDPLGIGCICLTHLFFGLLDKMKHLRLHLEN